MVEIIVAMIGAFGVVCAAIVPVIIGLRRARDENRDQHAENREALGGLTGKVEVMHSEVREMRRDFTRHLENHDRSKV